MAHLELGFLGLGIMGKGMVRNLMKAGHKVTLWNRTASKCEEFVKEGAQQGKSPAEVIQRCPVTIAMLADPSAALHAVFGEGGILEAMGPGKSYVDMSTVDVGTAKRISEAVTSKGGRYLEAPVSGSKQPAEAGQLIILAAGDEALFKEATPAFDAMGKKSFFLGPVGQGARMKLVVNCVMGTMVTALSEGMAVAEKGGLSQQTLLEVMDLGATSNPMFKLKGGSIIKGDFPPAFPLKHQQKDMRLALAMGDELNQPMPVAAAANAAFIQAKSLGFGENDMAAVYNVIAGKSGQ